MQSYPVQHVYLGQPEPIFRSRMRTEISFGWNVQRINSAIHKAAVRPAAVQNDLWRSFLLAAPIDASTSRSHDVTNITGFWSKQSSKNHWSQWEPYGILLLFLNVSLKSLLLFHDQLVLISLHHIWVKIASNCINLLFLIGIFSLILTCICVFSV